MKRLLLLALSMCAFSAMHAQVYVDASASGANDGSSWADAYTDLQAALDNTASGEIWVAAGTYTPGGDSTSTFLITTPVEIYGGFDGTEGSLDDRDIDANETTISGDNDDNDDPDDFFNNKEDNSRHVITIDSLIDGTVRLDGLTVAFGTNIPFGDHDMVLSSGAGVLAFSPTGVYNATFTQNYGGAGSAIMFFEEGSSNSTVEDSDFTGNTSTDQGVVHFFGSHDGTVRGSSFTDNFSVRGGIHTRYSDNTLVEDVTIEDNQSGGSNAGIYFWQSLGTIFRDSEVNNNSAATGGGIWADFREIDQMDVASAEGLLVQNVEFVGNSANDDSFGGAGIFWQPVGVRVVDCTFEGNQGGDIGGFYIDQRNEESDLSDTTRMLVKDTDFIGNTAEVGRAGGVWAFQGSPVFDNCLFEGNTATGFAGAMFIGGDIGNAYIMNSEFAGNGITAPPSGFIEGALYISSVQDNYILNTEFTENEADVTGALALTDVGPTLIDGCTFTENVGAGGGGAILSGFGNQLTITNSTFEGNVSDIGGAISSQNNFTSLTVSNSTFEGNLANNGGGGAMRVLFGIELDIQDCTFSQNTATGFGGAITTIQSGDSIPESIITIARSTFFLNSAEQGGAINLGNSEGMIVNNTFSNNSSSGGDPSGRGGAISINVSDNEVDSIMVLNNTFANNSGELAGNIAVFQDSAMATVLMQNNLLVATPGSGNVAIEAGEPDIVSLGGNLLMGSDNSNAGLEDIFDEPTDQILPESVPLTDVFVDPLLGDYHLIEGSPAIDAGVNTGAPDVDIDGEDRPNPSTNIVDAGSDEYYIIDNVEEVIDDATQLVLLPNPVRDMLYLQMNNDWTGDLTVRVMTLNGQQVRVAAIQKFGTVQTFQVDLSGLPAGQYEVLVSNGEQLLARKAIKQ